MNFDRNEIRNFPLKIIEMDHFLHNSDDLLENNTTNNRLDEMRRSRKCYNNDSKYTLLFIDSEKYRHHFEKTHLKLKNNIIVLDRHINFQSLDELYQFYNLFYNSKYWLLQGTFKCLPETESKELKRKSNQIIDKYSEDKNTELLLVLNSDDSYVRPILENAFTKLINNFSNSIRSTFEINYENILKSYLMKKFQNNEPLFKMEQLHSNLKMIRYNVIFTASSSNKTQFDFFDCYQEKPLAKLGNIFNKLKNVISTKPKSKYFNDVSNHQNSHTEFSLDSLPSQFYYLADNGINFNRISFNDDHYNRIKTRRGRDRSCKKQSLKDNQNIEMSNRFQTYIIRPRSKSKTYDKINNDHESADYLKPDLPQEAFHSLTDSKLSSEEEEEKKETESPNNSSMSSLSSTLSNYINKKKRLTKSTSFNFGFENIDDEKLIDSVNEIEQTNSNDSVVILSSEDFNYDYKSKHETKIQNYTESSSNRRNCIIDEKILRHPALVKQNLKSKSVDVIEITNIETNRIPTKTKYKKNSKLFQLNVKQINNTEECESQSRRVSVNSTSSNENKLKIATLNNYKLKKLTTQKPTSKAIVYSKSYQRQSRSPPPPISISPTGLIPPPPLPSPNSVVQKIVNTKNYLRPTISKINYNINSGKSVYCHLIKENHENEIHSTNENSTYNHLYLKKSNDNEKRINSSYLSVKNRYLTENNNLLVGSKLNSNGENNRFKFNNFTHQNTEKVF